MTIAPVFGKICQSRLQKLLPRRYIVLTTATLHEGTLSLWPTSRSRTRRTGIAKQAGINVRLSVTAVTDILIVCREPKSK
jgi:hypothetical protein